MGFLSMLRFCSRITLVLFNFGNGKTVRLKTESHASKKKKKKGKRMESVIGSTEQNWTYLSL